MKTQFDTIYNPMQETIEDRYLVVGYLSHDEDCGNPLEDSDGMGYVIGRGKYETRRHSESELFRALGLNSYGEPDYSLNPVYDRIETKYIAWVESLTDEQLNRVWRNAEELREHLLTETLGEYEMGEYVWSALYYCVEGRRSDYWDSYSEFLDYLEDWPELKLDWEEAWHEAREAREIGDPCAVVLDVYDHSGLHWSVSGGGTQCRWDTTSGAGVWLPDDCARDEVMNRARVYDHATIRESGYGKNKTYTVWLDRAERESFKEWGDAYQTAKRYAEDLIAQGAFPTRKGILYASEELAEQALEEYNAWLSGDCYGICVEVYEIDAEGEQGKMISDDACWGFIGSDFAEEELKGLFDYTVIETKKKVVEETKQDRIKNRFRDAMSNAL